MPLLAGALFFLPFLSTAHATPQNSQPFAYSGKLPKLMDSNLKEESKEKAVVREAMEKAQKKSRAGWLLCENKEQKSCQVVIVDGGGAGAGFVIGLLLNIFLPFAIGSWVVGDFTGGLIGVVGQLAGIAFLVTAAFFWNNFLYLVFNTLGGILLAAGYIIPIITVIFHTTSPMRRGPRRRMHRRRFRDEGLVVDTQSRSFERDFARVSSVPMMKFSF
jgi:hypothetical protein